MSRPAKEPGFRLERSDAHDRVMHYRLHAYIDSDEFKAEQERRKTMTNTTTADRQ